MVPALPPTPPAIVMTLAQFAAIERACTAALAPIVSQLPAGIISSVRRERVGGYLPGGGHFGSGFKMGPKTRGARDRSRKSRSNRRKG